MRDEFGRTIDGCPLCDSTDVRFRGRRRWDFAFTWARWFVELIASAFANDRRTTQAHWLGYGALDRDEIRGEMLEAKLGHKTPKRFWKCRACKREGHEF